MVNIDRSRSLAWRREWWGVWRGERLWQLGQSAAGHWDTLEETRLVKGGNQIMIEDRVLKLSGPGLLLDL